MNHRPQIDSAEPPCEHRRCGGIRWRDNERGRNRARAQTTDTIIHEFYAPSLLALTPSSIMGKISDWLSNKHPKIDEDILAKGVVWNARGEMQSCLFCDFTQRSKEKEILFEDNLVAAFGPQKPAAKQHLLVVPKKHISTVGDLTPEDNQVLERMREVAEQLLKCDASNMQFSFHIPPWNSIGENALLLFLTCGRGVYFDFDKKTRQMSGPVTVAGNWLFCTPHTPVSMEQLVWSV